MSREFLFKGKCLCNGKWAESMCPDGVMHCGTLGEDFDPKTVGQYTGHDDRCGQKIFEGDVVYVPAEDENAVVSWDEQAAQFSIDFDGWSASFDNFRGKEMEVVGNIHDEESKQMVEGR